MASCASVSGVSEFFSTVSLISWICAQMPQIYTNYKTKSAEGISPMFLLLWFMGDFLSFTSCLLNDVVLQFQVYLSLFFICNDLTLCYQYYYYNSVYPRKNFEALQQNSIIPEAVSHQADYHVSTGSIHIRHGPEPDETHSLSQSDGSASSSFGSISNSKRPSAAQIATVGTMLNSGFAQAMAIQDVDPSSPSQLLGLVLAWGCTLVYVSSRCPQLYKNYQRKSVDGMSPLLFGSALAGNLTYTLSILTSCEFLFSPLRTEFFWRQLPYILGSLGTIVFDIAYFYQRHIYRDAGRNNTVMGLETWEE